jgi:hypothetical protein
MPPWTDPRIWLKKLLGGTGASLLGWFWELAPAAAPAFSIFTMSSSINDPSLNYSYVYLRPLGLDFASLEVRSSRLQV